MTNTTWKDGFWEKLGNPNTFDSSSQFNPAFAGKLPEHLFDFIETEIANAVAEREREILEEVGSWDYEDYTYTSTPYQLMEKFISLITKK